MIPIDANTKIAFLINQHPDALEAIVSLSPHFKKLRNPLLRKLMASRTTIDTACRVGKIPLRLFFERLATLGFVATGTNATDKEPDAEPRPLPEAVRSLQPEKVVDLDVRPILGSGVDPLERILQEVRKLSAGHVLKVINSFEPAPLILLLKRQGFEAHAVHLDADTVETYFFRSSESVSMPKSERPVPGGSWEEIQNRYAASMTRLDVRGMEMPQPMFAILDALEGLEAGKALFVQHKRVPVFLLPELEERGIDYVLNDRGEGDVQMILYRN
ncbi:MAG: DUF2249 domain-containing protein [Saprospiraceae bacterium]|nr:DUF2249 domain-containing protein [Saprospiraceae bacterium]